MSSNAITVQRGGIEIAPRVAALWNELFAHHLSIGAAGIATIPAEQSWPLRLAHYRRLFDEQVRASLWLATREDRPVGYAVSYTCDFEGLPAVVLETLSVDPAERGSGIGSLLMDAVDDEAAAEGAQIEIVDVMADNPHARRLYLRRGYAEHSESWLRSVAPQHGVSLDLIRVPELRAHADRLGVQAEFSPGPDDTWVSADAIVEFEMRSGLKRASTLSDESFAALLAEFAAGGYWTVRMDLPSGDSADDARSLLARHGFRLSTERLLRRP